MIILNFGQAIEALKEGKKVARKGWNGKGMWLVLILGEEIDPHGEFQPFIAMKPVGDSLLVPWLASQTDMLAEDWEVIK